MKKIISTFILLIIIAAQSYGVRIKDICVIDKVRENILIGFGLVIGLSGSGDTKDLAITQTSMSSMLERLGVKINNDITIDARNVASVIVTANLPAFGRKGSKLDVIVSSVGNAKSLTGGTLIATPLRGADGDVYAVAQGSLINHTVAQKQPSKNINQTNSKIINGAIIEKELPFALSDERAIRLSLIKPDFTTAKRISNAINNSMNKPISKALDSGTVLISLKNSKDIVALITQIEQIDIDPDVKAKIVINDKDGIIVMNGNVTIKQCSITHGNINIKIDAKPTLKKTYEAKQSSYMLPSTPNLEALVKVLNTLGVSPKDIIGILTTMKNAGIIQAEIEII